MDSSPAEEDLADALHHLAAGMGKDIVVVLLPVVVAVVVVASFDTASIAGSTVDSKDCCTRNKQEDPYSDSYLALKNLSQFPLKPRGPPKR